MVSQVHCRVYGRNSWAQKGVRFVGLPQSWAALSANLQLVNDVLLIDLTAPGILLGLLGLFLAARSSRHRTAALTFIFGGLGAYAFHALLYTDVLSALILQVTLSLAVGWLFLMDWLLVHFIQRVDHVSVGWRSHGIAPTNRFDVGADPRVSSENPNEVRSWQTHFLAQIIIGFIVLLMALLLWAQNDPFIRTLTTNPAGLETISLVREAPPNATIMLPWGTRHFAVGFARDVWGQRTDLTLVDHKADFPEIMRCTNTLPTELDREPTTNSPALNSGRELEGGVDFQDDCTSNFGPLVTPDYVFYNYPVDWWQTQLDTPVYLRAAGPNLIEISSELQQTSDDLPDSINVLESAITCTPNHITLTVEWAAPTTPEEDRSVFVHLLDDQGNLVAQADQVAPVYGWRPLTSWLPQEVIHDNYWLSRATDSGIIRFGLYLQLPDGTFQNDYEAELPVSCDGDKN